MKTKSSLIIFALLTLLPIIGEGQTKPVPISSSFYPGYSKDSEIFIEKIIGSWASQSLIGDIRIESLNDGSYHVFSISIEETAMWSFFKVSFRAKLFRKDNLMFVDLMPMGSIFSDQLTCPSHIFAVIEITQNVIKVSIFDPYFVLRYLEKNSKTISTVRKDQVNLVIEQTQVIQRILVDIAKSPESIMDTIFLKRTDKAQPLR